MHTSILVDAKLLSVLKHRYFSHSERTYANVPLQSSIGASALFKLATVGTGVSLNVPAMHSSFTWIHGFAVVLKWHQDESRWL